MIDNYSADSQQIRQSRPWLHGRALGIDIAAVITSSAATGVLGFAFWTLAARGYATAEVGRASAIISSATLIAILANLSLGSLYERFLPLSGHHTRRYIRLGMTTILLAAVLFGVVFIAVGPREALFTGPLETALFPVFVAVLAAFAIQDQILIGLGRARTIATKNITQSTVKLILVGACIPLATGSAIVWAWVVPAAAITALVATKVIRPVGGRRDGAPSLPARAELVHFFVSSYLINAVGVVVPLLVPLIIVARLGTEMNAYFSMCWLVMNTLGVLINATAAPFIAAASSPGADLRSCTVRFTLMCGGAAVIGGLALLLTAPLVLGVMGSEYAAQGTTLIRLMALTLPSLALLTIYVALARLQRRLKFAVAVQILLGVVIVSGVAITTPLWGINAVGYTYLAAELLSTLLIAVPTVRLLRRALRPDEPMEDHSNPATPEPHPAPADRPLRYQSVIDQFDDTARRFAASPAVRTRHACVHYGELADIAARWGERLDTDPDRPRAVLLSAGLSTEAVGAIIALFASNSVLVAVDPGLPATRVGAIAEILERFGYRADTLLTDDPDTAPADDLPAHCRVSSLAPDAGRHSALGRHRFGTEDVTSIQFTSGSTGVPKAVLHGNGMWLCDAQLLHDRFGIGAQRRVALCLPISFGAGLNVLIGSLLAGAEVVAIDPRAETARSAFERLGDTGAQVMISTPAFLDAVATAAGGDVAPSLQRIITTGEAAHARHAHRARQMAPQATFTNWVGSSEASAIAAYDIAPGAPIPEGAVPAGIPAPHKVIDVAADGTVSVTSKYLALGYLDPAAAGGTFIDNRDGTRTFCGGDIGRWDPPGVLRLLGRAGAAVKIRGYLVEPAEIEAALLRYPDVREAAVLALDAAQSSGGATELVAYLAPAGDARTPSVAELRSRIHRDLPPWMAPAHIVMLTALPRTERGKLDLNALPPPVRAQSTPPRDGLEAAVAQIWAEVLQLGEVGRTESFYALGGDSLTVTQMLARISDVHGVRLAHADLAKAPTVAEFAATVTERSGAQPPAPRRRLAPTTVPIRHLSAETRPEPLFCFTGAGASALTFLPLADRAGAGAAVYAFVPNGLENRGIPDWTIQRAARRHLRDLRRIQPRGPYTLIGHSLGSYIAVEVARRLEAAGEEVALVALLDPFISPGAVRGIRRTLPNSTLTLDDSRLRRTELWRRRMLLPLAGLAHGNSRRQSQAMEEVGVRVGLMHRPAPWAGNTLLVLSHLNRDDERLWPHLLTGRLRIERLDCDHHSIVREPYVSAVVAMIEEQRSSRPASSDGVSALR